VIGTLAYVLSGLARVGVLRTLYASSTPSAEQRTAAVQNATKQLLQASAAHSLIARSHTSTEATQDIPQLNTAVQTALASLALGEATLLAVLKDDAYTFSCIQSRNPDDKEWMVRAPEIPKVRAVVFARLCLRAAEYAEQAAAGLGAAVSGKSRGEKGTSLVKVDEDLIKYAQTTAKVARAKACRFFGVDAELSGKTGEGIAWMRAGKDALGIRRAEGESAKGGTLSKLKKGWTDRRDERKLENSNAESTIVQGSELGRGDDAGGEEEGRVIEELESKWVKMNDTVRIYLLLIFGLILFSNETICRSSRRLYHLLNLYGLICRPGEIFVVRPARIPLRRWIRPNWPACMLLQTRPSRNWPVWVLTTIARKKSARRERECPRVLFLVRDLQQPRVITFDLDLLYS
jgi:hypothetical protein